MINPMFEKGQRQFFAPMSEMKVTSNGILWGFSLQSIKNVSWRTLTDTYLGHSEVFKLLLPYENLK